MTLTHFFLSPTGRISRLMFWLGLVALTAISVPVSLLLDPDALVQSEGKIKTPSLANTIWSLAISWPTAAISIKRFNDRDWPPWPGYVLFVSMATMVICHHNGLLLDPRTMALPEKLVFASMLIYSVWTLIDNGLYKGTEGPNRYGPDPLDRFPGAGV